MKPLLRSPATLNLMLMLTAGMELPVAGQAAVTLTPSPISLTFSYTIGNPIPVSQALAIRASAGTSAYTVTITGANSQWLTASPETGNLPAALTVRVNPTSLAVGTYQATINFAATGVANPLKLSVTLVVINALPALLVSATSLSFNSPPAQPAPQTFRLTTTGGPIPFTVATGAAWLSVTPSTGVVLPGSPVTVTVQPDSTSLAASATPYAGKITITATGVPAANKTHLVTVSFLVNALQPVITSIWPPSVLVNAPTATVTLRGTGFYAASVVMIGGQNLPTTVVSTTVLLATVPPVLLTTPGTLNFMVTNPPPGGSSTPIAFQVTASPVVQVVANAASQVSGSVSPGEIVTMFGQSIGPVTAYSMQDANGDGFVDSSVGGYSISIDGFPAPILYLSQDQMTVQIPYEVSQGAGKTIQVTNALGAGATGTINIIPAAPGVFSLDGSGLGQVAALNFSATNQTYSLNGASAPAHVGDTVIFYMTGEGDWAAGSIPVRTGFLIPSSVTPLPQISPLPAVTIGGQSATVSYAGPVVGSLIGILQINTTVPAGASTGPAVPVSVTFGTTNAQSGITLVVK